MQFLKVVTLYMLLFAFVSAAALAADHSGKKLLSRPVKALPGKAVHPSLEKAELSQSAANAAIRAHASRLREAAQKIESAGRAKNREKVSGTEGPYLSGIYHVGAGGDFTSLDAMAGALSFGTIGGPVTMLLTDQSYTTDALMISSAGTDSTPVVIRPDSGNTSCTISITDNAGFAGALVFSRATYTTLEGTALDGVEGTQNLTLTMTSTTSGDNDILFPLSDAAIGIYNDCGNVSVMNTVVQGYVGADYGSTGIGLQPASNGNHDITISGCDISNCRYGIFDASENIPGDDAEFAIMERNITITNNTIHNIVQIGLTLYCVSGGVASNNSITNIAYPSAWGSFDASVWGQSIPFRTAGITMMFDRLVTISGNTIDSIHTTKVFTGSTSSRAFGVKTLGFSFGLAYFGPPYGIDEVQGNSFINNTIADIHSDGTTASGFREAGFFDQGENGDTIEYNSISISGSSLAAQSSSLAGEWDGSDLGTTTGGHHLFIDNIFSVTIDNGAGTANNIAFADIDGAAVSPASNNNAYYAPGAILASTPAGNATNLAQYRTVNGSDGLSVQGNPFFTSNSDLHLDPAQASIAYHAGAPISEVTVDKSGTRRNATTPNIGAYEGAVTGEQHDAVFVGLVSPTSAGAPEGQVFTPVQIAIANVTSNSETGVPVTIEIEDSAFTPIVTLHGTAATLGRGATDTISVVSTWNPAYAGAYHFVISVNLAGDADHSNDSGTVTVFSTPLIASFPYSTNFDSPAAQFGWSGDGDWVLGDPVKTAGQDESDGWPGSGSRTHVGGHVEGAHSGNTCWVTNLNAPYTDGPRINHLYTPFFNFTSFDSGYLGFWQSISTEPSSDGTDMEWSTDGVTWHLLGALNDPTGVNWYSTAVYANAGDPNGAYSAGSGDYGLNTALGFQGPPYWTSNGSAGDTATGPYGYIYNQIKLPAAVLHHNYVRFRYSLIADAGGVDDGAAFDDFTVTPSKPVIASAVDSGMVYTDFNGDGIKNGSDSGLAGVKVYIAYYGAVTESTVTASGGVYVLHMTLPGNYTISIKVPAGAVVTAPVANSIAINYAGDGSNTSGDNFGIFVGSINGHVYSQNYDGSNKTGLSGWVVSIRDSAAGAVVYSGTSDVNGAYIIPLPGGKYYVTETETPAESLGFHQDGTRFYNVNTTGATSGSAGAVVTAIDFGNFALGRETVCFNNDFNGDGKRNPVQDVTQLPFFGYMVFTKGSDTLALDTMGFANKVISFPDLDTGSYIVTWTNPAAKGWTKTYAGPHAFTISKTGVLDTAAFLAFQRYKVRGIVYEDHNADSYNETGDEGVGGVVVSLAGSGTSTTDSNGFFFFTNVDTGSHLMTAAFPVGTLGIEHSAGVVVHEFSTVDDSIDNFGLFKTLAVSGKVYNDYNNSGGLDAGETGAAGLKVMLSRSSTGTNDSTVTDGQGNFSFAGVDTGHWHLTFTPVSGDAGTQGSAGYTFLTQSGVNMSGELFGQFKTSSHAGNNDTRWITVTIANGLSHTTDTMGTAIGATNCIDWEETELAPPPTLGTFDARFVEPGCVPAIQGLSLDLHGGVHSPANDTSGMFQMKIQPDTTLPILMTLSPGWTQVFPTLEIYDGDKGPFDDTLKTSPEQDTLSLGYSAVFRNVLTYHQVTNVVFVYTALPLSVPARNDNVIPKHFALSQNYPNPFNPTTTIQFAIERSAMTVVEVYNVLGQKVATLVDQQLAPGNFSARWNGTNDNGRTAASGVYFVRMHAQPTGGAAAFTQIRKIVLMK